MFYFRIFKTSACSMNARVTRLHGERAQTLTFRILSFSCCSATARGRCKTWTTTEDLAKKQ
jgi:hypothetical protein